MKNLEQQEIQSGREIPIDLLMDIFSRVPATTIARLRCVSKLWESIIGRPDFTELFLTMSWTRPPLLFFASQKDDKLFFSSSPHPQNPDECSSLVPTRYPVHHKISPTDFSSGIACLGGLICHRDRLSRDTMAICNPVTGESVSLPKVELKSKNLDTRPYLGYDPIHKLFKVLCIKSDGLPNAFDEHQVLTLDKGNKHLWRTIQCKPHYPKSNGICIDGILYYTAGFDRRVRVSMIVCFDVISEKFNFINIDKCMLMTACCTLINYKGKLAALQFMIMSPKLKLWVLEDAEKSIWSKDIYTVPPSWDNIVQRTELEIVGMTGGGEVVLSPYYLLGDAFYIYYFNLVSKSLARVQIQGLELFKHTIIYTSLDYAENLKLMTEYSPEGRLFQVKSASEATKLSERNLSNKEKAFHGKQFYRRFHNRINGQKYASLPDRDEPSTSCCGYIADCVDN